MKLRQAMKNAVALGALVLTPFVLAQAAKTTGTQGDNSNPAAEAWSSDPAGNSDGTIHFGW